MPHLPLAAIAAGLALCAGPALAGTHWLCGLSDDLTRLVCIADLDPVEAATSAAPPTASVRGTRFPLDPQRRWTVDFWSPPTEAAGVEFLARASICYRSPGCTVTVTLPAYLERTRSR